MIKSNEQVLAGYVALDSNQTNMVILLWTLIKQTPQIPSVLNDRLSWALFWCVCSHYNVIVDEILALQSFRCNQY